MYIKDVAINFTVPTRECGKSEDQFVRLEFEDALFGFESQVEEIGAVSREIKLYTHSPVVRTGLGKGSILNQIDRVIFNNPATIIIWADGSKTVVKVQDDEPFDQEKGLMACVMKKLTGNKGTFNDTLKKWCK